ncbi:hypothetical protein RUND412_001784 [Rhizina undulata]
MILILKLAALATALVLLKPLLCVASWVITICAVLVPIGIISALMAYFMEEIKEIAMTPERERIFVEKLQAAMYKQAMRHASEIRELKDKIEREEIMMEGLNSNMQEERLRTKKLKAEYQKQEEYYEKEITRLTNEGELKDAHILKLVNSFMQVKKEITTPTKKVGFTNTEHVGVSESRLSESTAERQTEHYNGHYKGDDDNLELGDNYFEAEDNSSERKVPDSDKEEFLDWEEEFRNWLETAFNDLEEAEALDSEEKVFLDWEEEFREWEEAAAIDLK